MERAPRVIYLDPTAQEIVGRLAGQYPDGKLLRNTGGRAWTADAVNCRLHTLIKKVGRKVCLTDFRHTWMNRLLLNGVDGITVAVLAGHSDVSTLSRTYQHLSLNPTYLQEQLKKLPGQLGHARRATAHPQRQWAGIHRHGDPSPCGTGRLGDAVHRAGKPVGERVCRIVLQPAAR